jgi:NAD(P)-dependent dehydrogenase (short-subunit alcohol dehydrogenase family)
LTDGTLSFAIPGPVLVTGAGSGIGEATARLLLAGGVPLVATDLDGRGMDALDGDVRRIVADLRSGDGRAAVLHELDRLAGIVHCAGVIRLADPLTLTEDDWDLVLDTNLKATFLLLQACLPLLDTGSSVVLISSVAAKHSATPESVAYSASKAGVLALTRTFAQYLAPRGVRVNALCPGLIDTPMQDALVAHVSSIRHIDSDQLERERRQTVPLGRVADASEVATVAAFLLSHGASYMTGQSVNVTGGLITH